MNKIRKNNTIKIKADPQSRGAKALYKLLIFNRIRRKFILGEIELEEFKNQLRENKINIKIDDDQLKALRFV